MSLAPLSDVEENHNIRNVVTICMDRVGSEVHPVVPGLKTPVLTAALRSLTEVPWTLRNAKSSIPLVGCRDTAAPSGQCHTVPSEELVDDVGERLCFSRDACHDGST